MSRGINLISKVPALKSDNSYLQNEDINSVLKVSSHPQIIRKLHLLCTTQTLVDDSLCIFIAAAFLYKFSHLNIFHLSIGSPRLHRTLFRNSDNINQKCIAASDTSSVSSPSSFGLTAASATSSPVSSPDWTSTPTLSPKVLCLVFSLWICNSICISFEAI